MQASGVTYVGEAQVAEPWYRQVSSEQWRAFCATFLGGVIDAFDFNILAFDLIDIQKSFAVDRALAGALGTVTFVMRAVKLMRITDEEDPMEANGRSKSLEIRQRLGHPILDADGHWLEFEPASSIIDRMWPAPTWSQDINPGGGTGVW